MLETSCMNLVYRIPKPQIQTSHCLLDKDRIHHVQVLMVTMAEIQQMLPTIVMEIFTQQIFQIIDCRNLIPPWYIKLKLEVTKQLLDLDIRTVYM